MTYLEKAAQAKIALLKFAGQITIPALTEACLVVLHDKIFITSFGGSKHHCYEGGLANHTLEVTEYAVHMGGMFPQANRDVIITAAIYHDYMKIKDYAGSNAQKGLVKAPYRHLVRHVAGSHAEFMKAIVGKTIPEEIVIKVEHAMLAHHGRLEWESPVVPQLIEAYILHAADNFSAHFGATRR